MNKTLIIQQALDLASKDADDRECSAGQIGYLNDGGASRIRELVEVYKAGLEHTIPDFLDYFVKEVRRQRDPEFSEYQRLKQKFE